MKICPVCQKQTDWLETYYDRHGIYSGKACGERCAETLPGKGGMWNYQADESIDPDEDTDL
ncbi:MAG: hypothetical protein HC924_17790 [Synechococcaceae cyanobacterium SM2_3_2]|nr:hypothetical protein [Synechococcaceae cyanobacterium SM2_3_2]